MKKLMYICIALTLLVLLSSCNIKELVIEEASGFREGLAAVKVDGKYGYINTDGELVIKNKYEKAKSFSEGLAAVMIDGKYGYIDTNGKLIIKNLYDGAMWFKDGVAKVKADKWGIIDAKGNTIIDTIYEDAYRLTDKYYAVKDKRLYGCVDVEGNMITDDKYSSIYALGKRFVILHSYNYQRGYIDLNTDRIYEPKYGELDIDLKNEVIFIRENGLWGMTDLDGNDIVEPKYNYMHIFEVDDPKDRKVLVLGIMGSYEDLHQVLDLNGNLLTNIDFRDAKKSIGGFFDYKGYLEFEENGKCGLMDYKGEIVVEPIYDRIGYSSREILRVKVENKWGLIDRQGETIIEPIFNSIHLFHDGAACVLHKDNKGLYRYGHIGKDGQLIIEPKYNEDYTFRDGKAVVNYKQKYGVIDIKGNEVIPPLYDEIQRMWNLYKVSKDNKFGIFDMDGRQLVDIVYEDFKFERGILAIESNGLWTLINGSNNTVIIASKCEEWTWFDDELCMIKLDGKWICIDKSGNIVFDSIY